MSKRPKTANAVMSRLRRPAGRLRDLPIWSKLGLIMLVPTLATIVVGTSGLIDRIDESNGADRARTLSVLSQAAGGLVDHLQNERTYGVMIAAAKPDSPEQAAARKSYNAEHALVDAAKLPYAQQRATLDAVPAKVDTLLVRLDRNLEDLPATRSQTANGALDADVVKQAYGRMIDDLLRVRTASAQFATNTRLSDQLRTVAALAQAKDFVAQQRAVGQEVVAAGDFNAGLRTDFLQTRVGYDLANEALRAAASEGEQSLFDRVVATDPKASAATNYSVSLLQKQGADTRDIPFNAQQWETAMTGYNGLFRQVERDLDARSVALATDLRDSVNRRVFLETSILLGMLLLAILFAWLVARSMARSLRELRQGALSVAQFGLPQAVRRLRDPALSPSMTPAQVADQVAEPLPVRSRDEFGQVTEAFNAVHLEAVRTAAEQAALRSSVATMFVNLARRSQILVDRLIGHLDRLERGEEDPDRLAELFQLDHLATRMRRNDENLLVLAGADSTRVQREPAALIDVLRAAQSEVEHYTRIEFGTIDRDIEVAAHAVNDMVHLVAELFDNATAFSPPNSAVIVDARRSGDSAVLSVQDRGIGISREQMRDLNERLASPPMVDVAVSRMMGLVVVARLANRHSVKVELRPADTGRGTVADVVLPTALLVAAQDAERLPAAAFAGPAEQPAGRPAYGEPLALESGRGTYPAGRPFDPNPPMTAGGMLGTNRSVPAWSDLTSPSNGYANGTNGLHGPRSNEPLPPPLPQGPPPGQGSHGFGDLPQRRNGEGFRPDADTGSFGATIPRQLPANPQSQGRGPFVPPPVSAPPTPPVSAPPVSATPVSSAPAVSAPPAASTPPPAWPPVAADRDGANPPHVPESLAAALDMTAELPRYRADRNGSRPQVARPANPQPVPPSDPSSGSGPADSPSSGSVPVSGPAASGSSTSGSSTSGPASPDSAASSRLPGGSSAPSDLPGGVSRPSDLPGGVSAPSGSSSALDSPVRSAPSYGSPTGPQSEAERSAAAAAAGHEAAAAQAAEAQATAVAQAAAAQAASRRRADGGEAQFSDETMELPIFRELESAWFIAAKPASAAPSTPDTLSTPETLSTPDAASVPVGPSTPDGPSAPEAEPSTPEGPSAGDGDDSPVTTQRFSTGAPSRSVPVSPPVKRAADSLPAGDDASVGASNGSRSAASMSDGSDGSPWQTAADEGWQAARAAADAPVATTTTAGLPKRTPMAQLVPGGVDRGGVSVQRRTPEAVRGLLSAYHRGVQRGRTKEQSTNPEETSGGQQSPRTGKEFEA